MSRSEHFKKILEARRIELAEMIEKLEDRLDDPKNPDFEERSVEREEDEVMETQVKTGYDELEAIDSALQRIENNSYGNCIVCRDEISDARLEAVPYANVCRNCMEH